MVLFVGDYSAMLSNIGDYKPDLVKWPSGIGAAKGRIQAAGLQVRRDLYLPCARLASLVSCGMHNHVLLNTYIHDIHTTWYMYCL